MRKPNPNQLSLWCISGYRRVDESEFKPYDIAYFLGRFSEAEAFAQTQADFHTYGFYKGSITPATTLIRFDVPLEDRGGAAEVVEEWRFVERVREVFRKWDLLQADRASLQNLMNGRHADPA